MAFPILHWLSLMNFQACVGFGEVCVKHQGRACVRSWDYVHAWPLPTNLVSSGTQWVFGVHIPPWAGLLGFHCRCFCLLGSQLKKWGLETMSIIVLKSQLSPIFWGKKLDQKKKKKTVAIEHLQGVFVVIFFTLFVLFMQTLVHGRPCMCKKVGKELE